MLILSVFRCFFWYVVVVSCIVSVYGCRGGGGKREPPSPTRQPTQRTTRPRPQSTPKPELTTTAGTKPRSTRPGPSKGTLPSSTKISTTESTTKCDGSDSSCDCEQGTSVTDTNHSRIDSKCPACQCRALSSETEFGVCVKNGTFSASTDVCTHYNLGGQLTYLIYISKQLEMNSTLTTTCSRKGKPVPTSGRPCSVEWNLTRCLHNKSWLFPPITERIIEIDYKDGCLLTFKMNLTYSTKIWAGQLAKIHVRCGTDEQILFIKVQETFKVSDESHITDSTSLSGSTDPTRTVGLTTSPTPESTNYYPSQDKSQSNGSSSAITIIVACITAVVLVIAGILIVIYCKRRRPLRKESSNGIELDQKQKTTTAPFQSSFNPIYTSGEDDFKQNVLYESNKSTEEREAGAMNECVLYEPAAEPVYHDIEEDRDNTSPQSHEKAYDYAANDDVQRSSPGSMDRKNFDKTEEMNGRNSVKKGRDDVLENEGSNAERFYNILER